MKLAVMIEGQEGVTWPQWVDLARASERHGFAALFRSDHYLSFDDPERRGALDAWATLAALAPITERIGLGTLVSPGTFRHPSVLAKSVVTVDHASGGRAELGMGAGWFEREHAAFGFPFPGDRERLDVLAEQVEIVHRQWTEDAFDFSGRFYELRDARAQPRPVQRPRPPLLVGGGGGRGTVEAALRFADEYNTPFATADDVRERRGAVAEAWQRAGRDPATLRFSVMTGAVLGRTPEEVEARKRSLGERRDEPDFDPPPAWICGTVDEAAAQLAELAAAGCDRVMLQLLLHDDLDQVALIGGELAAAVRDA